MPQEATLQVRERAPTEDVVEFVERCAQEIANVHSKRSPLCMSTNLDYMKIPVQKDGGIGDAEGGTA